MTGPEDPERTIPGSSPTGDPDMPATGHVPSRDEVNEEIRACVAEHGAALLAYLRGHTLRLPPDLADEVLNDVLKVVWRKRSRGEEITLFRQYLFQVARNAAIGRLQQRFPQAEVTGQDALLDSQEDTRDLIANADLAEDLRRAVLALPDQRRKVITLRVLCDFSIAETAEILGIAEGTVGSTTSSALRQSRDAMAREHHRHPRRDETRQAQAELKIEDI